MPLQRFPLPRIALCGPLQKIEQRFYTSSATNGLPGPSTNLPDSGHPVGCKSLPSARRKCHRNTEQDYVSSATLVLSSNTPSLTL